MERFKCPVGVFLVLRKNNKVYLQLRKNCSFSGMFGAIGGHLDGQETIVNALIREAKEEAGIDVKPQDLDLMTICHSNAGGKEYLQFFYQCSNWNGEVMNMEPDKCEIIQLFDINLLPDNIVPYLKSAFDKFNDKIIFFEEGFV